MRRTLVRRCLTDFAAERDPGAVSGRSKRRLRSGFSGDSGERCAGSSSSPTTGRCGAPPSAGSNAVDLLVSTQCPQSRICSQSARGETRTGMGLRPRPSSIPSGGIGALVSALSTGVRGRVRTAVRISRIDLRKKVAWSAGEEEFHPRKGGGTRGGSGRRRSLHSRVRVPRRPIETDACSLRRVAEDGVPLDGRVHRSVGGEHPDGCAGRDLSLGAVPPHPQRLRHGGIPRRVPNGRQGDPGDPGRGPGRGTGRGVQAAESSAGFRGDGPARGVGDPRCPIRDGRRREDARGGGAGRRRDRDVVLALPSPVGDPRSRT